MLIYIDGEQTRIYPFVDDPLLDLNTEANRRLIAAQGYLEVSTGEWSDGRIKFNIRLDKLSVEQWRQLVAAGEEAIKGGNRTLPTRRPRQRSGDGRAPSDCLRRGVNLLTGIRRRINDR